MNWYVSTHLNKIQTEPTLTNNAHPSTPHCAQRVCGRIRDDNYDSEIHKNTVGNLLFYFDLFSTLLFHSRVFDPKYWLWIVNGFSFLAYSAWKILKQKHLDGLNRFGLLRKHTYGQEVWVRQIQGLGLFHALFLVKLITMILGIKSDYNDFKKFCIVWLPNSKDGLYQ